VQIDSFDLKILDVLQRDGRITNARLALDVGLSESACFNRVKRLEQQKVLQRYAAQFDQKAIGSFVTVVVCVTLESHKQHESARFEQIVAATPEVVECLFVAGQFDYMLKVVARDMTDYLAIMDGLMEAFGKMSQFSSYIVMRKTKEEPMPASYMAKKARQPTL
jgi:Lrp/AsnC family transcriptional regulator of ectoine degradation